MKFRHISNIYDIITIVGKVLINCASKNIYIYIHIYINRTQLDDDQTLNLYSSLILINIINYHNSEIQDMLQMLLLNYLDVFYDIYTASFIVVIK